MVDITMRNTLLAIILAGVIAAALPELTLGQNCGCAPNFCCSRFGYCGTTDEYCGEGCQSGPCRRPPTTGGGGGGVSVPNTVTEAFFGGIIGKAANNCAGKRFYTRNAFLEAQRSYPKFGGDGGGDNAIREIAAFFAHVTHETGHFCYIEEINGATRNYCDPNNRQWPCVPGKGYYGRGPIQISWNYNYGPAGRDIGFDGLRNPERVATDPVISFKTAFWFWMGHCHSIMVSGRGFGETIRAINGQLECNGANPGTVTSRVQYYTDYCRQLGVSPGDNLRC